MQVFELNIDEYIFQHPFTAMIAGPTQSGKSTIIRKIIEYNQTMITPKPTKIWYCYSTWQKDFQQLKLINPAIQFNEGVMDFDVIDPNEVNMVILDDLMANCTNNETVLNLFVNDSHHRNISVFFITQNLFNQGKHCRTISLNSHYIIILNNPRDRSQISNLGRQMYPKNSKFINEVYEDATNAKYGYLFIDLKQSTDNRLRLQTGVLPGQQRIVYLPKE